MLSPDEQAATFDPDAPPVTTVAELTDAHIGKQVKTFGVVGELIAVAHNGHLEGPEFTSIVIQEAERPFGTRFDLPSATPCEIVDGVVALTDIVDMNDFYALARELDRVSKEITSNDAATKALKERKRELSEQLLGTFAQVGQETLGFDDRRAYIHHEIFPDFEERVDGTKYGYADLVPVLKSIGREEQVTKETVGYRTMQGLLREIRDGVIPMPPELAKMVKIGVKAEVRTGVGRKSKR